MTENYNSIFKNKDTIGFMIFLDKNIGSGGKSIKIDDASPADVSILLGELKLVERYLVNLLDSFERQEIITNPNNLVVYDEEDEDE